MGVSQIKKRNQRERSRQKPKAEKAHGKCCRQGKQLNIAGSTAGVVINVVGKICQQVKVILAS